MELIKQVSLSANANSVWFLFCILEVACKSAIVSLNSMPALQIKQSHSLMHCSPHLTFGCWFKQCTFKQDSTVHQSQTCLPPSLSLLLSTIIADYLQDKAQPAQWELFYLHLQRNRKLMQANFASNTVIQYLKQSQAFCGCASN